MKDELRILGRVRVSVNDGNMAVLSVIYSIKEQFEFGIPFPKCVSFM